MRVVRGPLYESQALSGEGWIDVCQDAENLLSGVLRTFCKMCNNYTPVAIEHVDIDLDYLVDLPWDTFADIFAEIGEEPERAINIIDMEEGWRVSGNMALLAHIKEKHE